MQLQYTEEDIRVEMYIHKSNMQRMLETAS